MISLDGFFSLEVLITISVGVATYYHFQKKREKEVEKVLRTNAKLVNQIKIYNSKAPAIKVPSVPKYPDAPSGWTKINDQLTKRQPSKKIKNQPRFLRSFYKLGDRAEDKIKIEINEFIVDLLRSVFPDLPTRLQDPRNIIILLDAPLLVTTKMIIEAFPSLRTSQQIIIPQYDLAHYIDIIQNPDVYVGVRAQRLDQWFHVNRQQGLQCLLFWADLEQCFIGNRKKQLSPALDIRRYFMLKYPAKTSILVLTVETHDSTLEILNDFVTFEAKRNGYRATLVKQWKYHLFCLIWKIERLN